MHGGAGGGVGGPLPGEPKDPWEVRDRSEISSCSNQMQHIMVVWGLKY